MKMQASQLPCALLLLQLVLQGAQQLPHPSYERIQISAVAAAQQLQGPAISFLCCLLLLHSLLLTVIQ